MNRFGRAIRRWIPTPIEIAVALAILAVLFSYDWAVFPPAMCAQLKAHGARRTAWDAFWLSTYGC